MEIFLSHVSTEGLLTLVLKEWIQAIFDDRIKVFVSSDIKNIATGDPWLGELRSGLCMAEKDAGDPGLSLRSKTGSFAFSALPVRRVGYEFPRLR